MAIFRLDDSEIVIAKYNDLYKQKIIIEYYYIADNQTDRSNIGLIVKVRYRLHETPCELNILDKSREGVRFLNPEAMIANGQTAVFYDKDRFVGCGFTKSSKSRISIEL